jgi:hypothetical protein
MLAVLEAGRGPESAQQQIKQPTSPSCTTVVRSCRGKYLLQQREKQHWHLADHHLLCTSNVCGCALKSYQASRLCVASSRRCCSGAAG